MSSTLPTAARALDAWERGDHSGSRAMLSPTFRLFCHPAPPNGRHGVHAGPDARAELDAPMADRELRPRALAFTDVVMLANGDTVVALFDVSGSVAADRPYAGQGAIAFLIDAGGVAGFRDYVGGGARLEPGTEPGPLPGPEGASSGPAAEHLSERVDRPQPARLL